MSEDTEARTIFDAGVALGNVRDVGGTPFVIVPEDFDLIQLGHLKEAPPAATGNVKVIEPDSFTRYVNQFKDERSMLFADPDKATFTAILDYHVDPKKPGWGRHHATLDLPYDPDFDIWRRNDGVEMKQAEFAEFIENMVPTIIKPDGAEILEIAQHLEVTRKVKFKSATRLQSGTRQFQYEEETEGHVSRNNIEIPEAFTIKVRVFRWSDYFQIEAKLRYRLHEGKLVLFYKLHRLQDVLDEAFTTVREAVEVETALKAHYGAIPTGIGK